MYCIEPDQDIIIRGQNEIDSVSLNLDFVACTKNSSVCKSDQTKSQLEEKLKHPELIILYNNFEYNIMNFDEGQAEKRFSTIWNSHIDKR